MKSRVKICTVVMIAALTVSLLGGCIRINVDLDGQRLTGNGEMVTEETEIEGELKGVINSTSFDVVIDTNLTGKVVIEGESNLIDLVQLSRDKSGVLVVQVKPNTSFVRLKQMTVRIPAITMGRVVCEGSGDITLEGDALKGDAFDLEVKGSGDIRISLEKTGNLGVSISGSGNVDAEAEADALYMAIVGSGKINLSGSAGKMSLTIGGSGDFNGFDFPVGDADINISGSGDANINLSGKLTGSVNGSGNITYAGNPESVRVDDNGSGRVRER